MDVGDLMSAPVYAVAPGDSLARARKLMLRQGISRLVVMDGEDLKGIITKKDLAWRLNQSEPQWRRRPLDRVPVDLIMTPDPVTIKPSDSVKYAACALLNNKISGVIVYDDGVKGILTKHDMVRFFTITGCPLKVGDMMSKNIVTVSMLNTVNSVMDIMVENCVDRVVVTSDVGSADYAGIITMDDLGFVEMNPHRTVEIRETRKDSPGGRKMDRYVRYAMMVAEEVMSSPLVSVNANMPAIEAAKLMMEHNYDMLPVINGDLRGQFNYENILVWLSEESM